MKKDKVIRQTDHETWRRFAGHCKMKGIKIGDAIAKILKKYLEE